MTLFAGDRRSALLGLGIGTSGRAADCGTAALPMARLAGRGDVDRDRAAAQPGQGCAPGRELSLVRSRADRIRPVWPAQMTLDQVAQAIVSKRSFKAIDRFLRRLNFGGGPGLADSGDSIATILLWRRWSRFSSCSGSALGSPGADGRPPARRHEPGWDRSRGSAELPEGIRPRSDDPWAEALRRRAAGDFAGAVVCLFAHQLLSLDQLGLIRLAPGRTGVSTFTGLRDRELARLAGRDPPAVRGSLLRAGGCRARRRSRRSGAEPWRFEERRSVAGSVAMRSRFALAGSPSAALAAAGRLWPVSGVRAGPRPSTARARGRA